MNLAGGLCPFCIDPGTNSKGVNAMVTADRKQLSPSDSTPVLIDVGVIAAMLGCSKMHVRRLVDAGKMPPPIRLGVLCKWRREDIAAWIQDGCPPIRTLTAKGAK